MEQICRTRIGEYCYNQLGGQRKGSAVMCSTIIPSFESFVDFKSGKYGASAH